MKVHTHTTADLAKMAAPYNPRKISDHDLESLRKSMRFFGVVEPVVINTRSGNIVGGHQRVRAAEAEGIEELPVVQVDLDDPSEKQLNLALNRISGEWDEPALAAMIAELDAGGADMELTGFDELEANRFLGLDKLPEFEPSSEDEQTRLDQVSAKTCPKCGHEF